VQAAIQAEQVARAVAQHIREFPNKSLGVACLSVQQRDAVDDMIDKIGIRTEVEGFIPKEERLFVKNLEAVQGDERDVIFISVGYGVAPNQSKPFLNFGPVSQQGGERRLNVLASRAREKCVVLPLRRATVIAPAEYQLALLTIIAEAVEISGDDLVVETARLFGFDRTGPDLKEAIDRQVEKLVKERRLHRGEDGFQLPDGNAP
jgi:hypothetical protein